MSPLKKTRFALICFLSLLIQAASKKDERVTLRTYHFDDSLNAGVLLGYTYKTITSGALAQVANHASGHFTVKGNKYRFGLKQQDDISGNTVTSVNAGIEIRHDALRAYSDLGVQTTSATTDPMLFADLFLSGGTTWLDYGNIRFQYADPIILDTRLAALGAVNHRLSSYVEWFVGRYGIVSATLNFEGISTPSATGLGGLQEVSAKSLWGPDWFFARGGFMAISQKRWLNLESLGISEVYSSDALMVGPLLNLASSIDTFTRLRFYMDIGRIFPLNDSPNLAEGNILEVYLESSIHDDWAIKLVHSLYAVGPFAFEADATRSTELSLRKVF